MRCEAAPTDYQDRYAAALGGAKWTSTSGTQQVTTRFVQCRLCTMGFERLGKLPNGHICPTCNCKRLREYRAAQRGNKPDGRRKLTPKKVERIRQMRSKGLTMAAIGKRIGISPSQVYLIVSGQSWK